MTSPPGCKPVWSSRFLTVGTGFLRPVKRRRRLLREVLICVWGCCRPNPRDRKILGGMRRDGVEASRALRARRGQLSRFAAAAVEHRRHQAEDIRLHAAIAAGSHLGGAALRALRSRGRCSFFPFHASAWACVFAPEDAVRPTMAGAAQFRVNFWYRMNTGAGAASGLINHSSCSSKPRQSFQSRVPFGAGRGKNPGGVDRSFSCVDC